MLHLLFSLASAEIPATELVQLSLTWGKQCSQEEPKGGPADDAGLQADLGARSVSLLARNWEVAVCEACDCPSGAVDITVHAAHEATVREIYPAAAITASKREPSATVTGALGRACQPMADGVPANPIDVVNALQKADVRAWGAESAMSCQACGTCPKFSFVLYVHPEDALKAKDQLATWAPPPLPPTTRLP